MHGDTIRALLIQVVTDPRLLLLLGMVCVDLVCGIAAALKDGTFDLRSVGAWYEHNVIPYLLSYAGILLITRLGIASMVGVVPGEVAATALMAPALGALTASIQQNYLELTGQQARSR